VVNVEETDVFCEMTDGQDVYTVSVLCCGYAILIAALKLWVAGVHLVIFAKGFIKTIHGLIDLLLK